MSSNLRLRMSLNCFSMLLYRKEFEEQKRSLKTH